MNIYDFLDKNGYIYIISASTLCAGAAFFRALSKGKSLLRSLIIAAAAFFLGGSLASIISHFSSLSNEICVSICTLFGLAYDKVVFEIEKTLTTAGQVVRGKIENINTKK